MEFFPKDLKVLPSTTPILNLANSFCKFMFLFLCSIKQMETVSHVVDILRFFQDFKNCDLISLFLLSVFFIKLSSYKTLIATLLPSSVME